MSNVEHEAAVGRAFARTKAAEQKMVRLETQRHTMVSNLTELFAFVPSKIVLGDSGKLRGLISANTGNYNAADLPVYPSYSELKNLLARLQEAEKGLAEAQRDLHDLHEQS